MSSHKPDDTDDDQELPPTSASSTQGDAPEVLSYFDPNYVKADFQEIMAKSRNIVIGPPREILAKYFGYKDEDQIPEELQHDDSPKAFILPRKFWKEYDDKSLSDEEEEATTSTQPEPSRKDVDLDVMKKDGIDTTPRWTPASWKPPTKYKEWIHNSKTVAENESETSVKLDDDPTGEPPVSDSFRILGVGKKSKKKSHTVLQYAQDTAVKMDEELADKLPGSDWFRAFGVVTKAEKDGDIEKYRPILGHIEGEDLLFKLEHPDEAGSSDEEEEEDDPMERLPRGDLPSRREYPEHPTPGHFKYYRSYPLYPTLSSERYFEWYKDVNRLSNPFAGRKFHRPAGFSKSMGNINWNDPKEAAKWYALGYRRPPTAPKPERPDFNTKDYIYDNARSIMLMPPRRVLPKYIDDRHGTSHLLEPSGLVKKFIFREDFGKVPDYLMGRNEELGRPQYPDMDKFYRPHRCKYLHGHIHCKICMRAHPTVKTGKHDWSCDMTPRDYERSLEYKSSKRLLDNNSSTAHFYFSPGSKHKTGTTTARNNYDVESMLNDLGLGEEYRKSKAARGGTQNSNTVTSSFNPVNVILPPMYV